MFHVVTIIQLLALLTLANGSPVVAKKLLGARLSFPVDCNATFFDGAAIFGASKTWRGLIAAILATALGAPLVGLDVKTGLVVGLFAMIGDLLASFTKRRLHLAPSSQAVGLDQIPESLLPLLAASFLVPLTTVEIIVAVAAFFIGEVLLSPILWKMGLRDRPF